MVAAMATVYSASLPETTVVIEIKIVAEINLEDEISVLPTKMINIRVHRNGALSFYGDDDNDSKEEKEN
jgi:hypothetical protein